MGSSNLRSFKVGALLLAKNDFKLEALRSCRAVLQKIHANKIKLVVLQRMPFSYALLMNKVTSF